MPEMSENDVCPSELKGIEKCVFCEINLTEEAESILGAQILICFHSVCKTCVDQWSETDKKACPICKVQVPKDLIANKLLQELVEKPHSDSTRKGMCGMHNDTPASRWCHQCSSLVCDECIKNHYKLKATSTHNLVDADGFIPTSDESLVDYHCNLHPTKLLEIYCIKCDMMTCRDCQLEHHRQHSEYEFIADHCKNYKLELIGIHERICASEAMLAVAQDSAEQIEKHLRGSKLHIHQQVAKLQQYLVQMVNDRCKYLLTELDAKIDAEIAETQTKIQATSKREAPLKHFSQIIELMLYHASDNTIIHSKKHIQKCAQLLRKMKIHLPNADGKSNFTFWPGENLENLVSQIKRIGVLRVEPAREHEAVYNSLLEKKGFMRTQEERTTEKPVNPPVRIQLRQDLQSPEGLKSMERLSIDPSKSANPDIGGMPHWHTPQGPPMSQVRKQTATVPTPVIPPNVHVNEIPMASRQPPITLAPILSPQPPIQQLLQMTSSPTFTNSHTQTPPDQRMLPPNPGTPKQCVTSEPPQQMQSTQQMQPTQQMQQTQQMQPTQTISMLSHPVPQYQFSNNQHTQFTRTVQQSSIPQRRSSDPQTHNLTLQNLLSSNSVTLRQINSINHSIKLHQQQQQQHQTPHYPLNQPQTAAASYMGPTYLPGSTHSPYPPP